MDGISPVCSLTIEPKLLRATILAAVNFGKPLSEAAPNSGIVKALRPLVARLDDSAEQGGDAGTKKTTSVLVRFTQGIKRKKK